MHAVRIHAFGGPETLRLDHEVDRPAPGPGQVLVAVTATAFNPIDALIRLGVMSEMFPVELPHVPGVDVAGIVTALGDDVTTLAVGQRVVGYLPAAADGASAEYVVALAEALVPAPRTLDLSDAAALPSTGLSAWQALFEFGDVQPDQRLLVVGAGGALGGLAVQLAAQAGVDVTASAASRHHDRLHRYDARRLVGPLGQADDLGEDYDVVLNLAPVDERTAAKVTDLVTDGGLVVSTAVPVPGDLQRGVRTTFLAAHGDAPVLTDLVDRVDAGRLRLHVVARRPLAELPEVHAEHAIGALAGKTVITVA